MFSVPLNRQTEMSELAHFVCSDAGETLKKRYSETVENRRVFLAVPIRTHGLYIVCTPYYV